VKFLVDNQLPAALARFIESKGCEVSHVLDVGLAEAPDSEIFRRAERDGCVLVSKDEDFLHLVLRPGTSAGLVWVRIGNCRKQHLLEVFERTWLRIVERLEAGERIVEVR
jgi:predicted nuclease of predicted toxin-antitoxin system